MSRYRYYDVTCPDCNVPTKYGGHTLEACGLTRAEHRYLRKLREQANREAHQLVLKAKAESIRPQAIVKAFYDEAEQAAKRHIT